MSCFVADPNKTVMDMVRMDLMAAAYDIDMVTDSTTPVASRISSVGSTEEVWFATECSHSVL